MEKLEDMNVEVPKVESTGEIDTASLMVLINKNAAEIKNRATISDLESLEKKMSFKADHEKELKRLSDMFSRLSTVV